METVGSGYNKEEIKRLIYEELPRIIREHPEVKVELWNLLSGAFTPKEETEDRFEKLLNEIQRHREESNKKFEEYQKHLAEHDKKFNAFWAEVRTLREDSNRKFEEMLNEIPRVDRRIDRTIGALGAR